MPHSIKNSRLQPIHKGILLILAAMLIFSVLNAIIKGSNDVIHPVQLVFFRCLFACIPCGLALTIKKQWQWQGLASQWKLHALRAVLLAIGLTSLYTGVSDVPLSNSISLFFSSSLFLVCLSPLILGEKVGPIQWVAVIFGFVGVLVIAKPSADATLLSSLFIIIGALFESIYNLVGRKLSQHTNSLMLTLMGSFFPSMIILMLLPFFWTVPDVWGWMALIGMGLGGGTAQICITKAYEYAPAGIIAPMIYSAIIWSVLLDIILYQDLPSFDLILGCLIIVSSGFIIIYQESRTKRQIAS